MLRVLLALIATLSLAQAVDEPAEALLAYAREVDRSPRPVPGMKFIMARDSAGDSSLTRTATLFRRAGLCP